MAAGLALPLVVRDLIGRVEADERLASTLMILTVLMAANAILGAGGGYVLERAGERVVLDTRGELSAHVIRLRVDVLESREPGDLIARLTADTTVLRAVLSQLVQGVTGVLAFAAALLLMWLLDGILFAVTISVLAVAGFILGILVPRLNRAARQVQESIGDMGTALERVVGAFRTVKTAGTENLEEERVDAASRRAYGAGVESAKLRAVAGNTASFAVQGALLAVIGVGGARTAAGALDIGSLVAFLLYVYYLLPPLQQVVSAVALYQTGAAAIDRIESMLALPAEDLEVNMSGEPERTGSATVEFRGVYFNYNNHQPESSRKKEDVATSVLADITFSCAPEGLTALVGPSGGGKTTLLSLLEKMYTPDAGTVLVDGVDVQLWSTRVLRSAIGYVEQDAPVLSGTLRENIFYGIPEPERAEVAEVVTTARLDSLVSGLPAGLDTQVGPRGVKLSGGERQRVAIARALARRPRVLLLDEATSQLDAVNEAALRDTISDISTHTTTLVVAHRLSTVTMAERIVVVEEGQVTGVGTHDQLVATHRLYSELASTQFITSLAEGTQ